MPHPLNRYSSNVSLIKYSPNKRKANFLEQVKLIFHDMLVVETNLLLNFFSMLKTQLEVNHMLSNSNHHQQQKILIMLLIRG